MLFSQLCAVLLGLAAFASTLPNPSEQRMSWTPRSLEQRGDEKKHKDKDVTITDTTVVKLTEEERDSEVELTVKVEEKIKVDRQKNKAKDNVRKNHYRNKNKDENTVIIVITEILDIRDSKNHNTRYMGRRLRADNKEKVDVTIQVTEVEVITISNSDSKHKGTKTNHHHDSTASAFSGSVANAIQTVDPNAPYLASNQTMLMPSGAAAPKGQNVENDPAAIVEDSVNDLIVEVVST